MKKLALQTLQVFTLAIVSAIFLISYPISGESAEGTTLVINNSGGAMEKVSKEIFAKPYTQKTGTKLKFTAPINFAKLKAMCESNNIEWDITELNAEDVVRGKESGYLEPIDYNIVDKSDFLPGLAHSHAIPVAFYSTVLAYNTKKFPAGKEPKSWADFWNVKKFPGPRSLRNHPQTLELALLADGVLPDQLYPLDEKRAWKSIDKIKPYVSVWWSMGAKPPQLLADGEVDMTSSYNGRITAIKKEGVPVKIQWNQQILLVAYMGIVKGSKHKEEAMKYLDFMMKPEQQADWVKSIPYPGPSKSMFDLLSPELSKTLPTFPAHYKLGVNRDSDYWVKNNDRLLEEWTAWMMK